jgi:protein arginine kinase
MRSEEILGRPASGWTSGSGPDADIVISTRIRLARNVAGVPFPHLLTDEGLKRVIADVAQATKAVNASGGWGAFSIHRLHELSTLDRQVLVEKHLVSPHHVSEPRGRAVVVSDDERVSIMVNEEDHLRLQCLFPGLQLEEAWVMASGLDDLYERELSYAFSGARGYLTCCPTNVGTGLRASVMLHLPALVVTEGAGRFLSAVNKLGLVVRGLYGEGTQAAGNLFQISNQVTLGHSEEEVVRNLMGIAKQVVEQERRARHGLLSESKHQVLDRTGRAYGILANAYVMSSEEALRLWSDVRLGIDLELLPPVPRAALNELIVSTRPAFLQRMAGKPLDAGQRDILRADVIRKTLARR